MSEAAPKIDLKRKYTYAEWYEIIQTSETKYDFVDGYLIDIRAMAGGTESHSRVAFNTIRVLGNALEGKPCQGHSSDMAVRAKNIARYHYPDVSVVCGPSEFEPDDVKHLVLLNPRVIIEVLSASTEGMDRGLKFRDYMQIESLREYVLVSQDRALVETFERRDDGSWIIQHWTGLDATARLKSIEVDLPLKQVYAGVTFPESTAAEA